MDDPAYGNLKRFTRQAWLRSTDTTAFPSEMADVCERVYAAGLIAGLIMSTVKDPIVATIIAEAKALYEEGDRDAKAP